jgi:hypothetical protein
MKKYAREVSCCPISIPVAGSGDRESLFPLPNRLPLHSIQLQHRRAVAQQHLLRKFENICILLRI